MLLQQIKERGSIAPRNRGNMFRQFRRNNKSYTSSTAWTQASRHPRGHSVEKERLETSVHQFGAGAII
eukprot:scaffold442_cov268-Pinguiococcus_pyrenoidosus.AAC.120